MSTNFKNARPQDDVIQWPEVELNEESITASLAVLQELHIALRNIRQSFPSLVDSVLPPSTPEQLYTNFSAEAKSVGKHIRHLSRLVREDRFKETLERAKQSREADPEDIGCWRVEEHPDWLGLVEGTQDDGKKVKRLELRGKDNGEKDEDFKQTIDAFRTRHGGIAVTTDEEKGSVKVALPRPTNMRFTVQRTSTPDGKVTYLAKTKSKAKQEQKIIEAIDKETDGASLSYILDMVSSYQDVKTRPCDKCSRLIDPNGQFPIVRRERERKNPDDQGKDRWQALHSSCA